MVVEDNDRLSYSAGNAFVAFKRYAASLGRNLSIAEPAGAYRSLAVQRDMKANPGKYNLNPNSGAKLAPVGKSGHGDANCVDLVGTSLVWIVANAGRFGFSRPLSNDPNHFRHDGVTAVGGTATQITALREVEMLGIEYYEPQAHPTIHTRILVDMVNRTGYYPDADEQSVFEQSGGRFIGMNDAMWTRAVGPLHITATNKPATAPVGGGTTDLTPVLNAIAGVPAAVIVEQKKPGN
jgi:hypothetical protein